MKLTQGRQEGGGNIKIPVLKGNNQLHIDVIAL